MVNKEILAVVGSASRHSANRKLLDYLSGLFPPDYRFIIFEELSSLPHFDVELSSNEPPKPIITFRNSIERAAGVIICTPEYVFSIPSGLKNAIEWCVATTVFSDKPAGLITASADGRKGHEELQLIMKTMMAKFNDDTTLLIPGIKGKITADGNITDAGTREACIRFADAFHLLLES